MRQHRKKVYGEVAERFKAAVLKTAVDVSPPWVRIPPSPPNKKSPEVSGLFLGRKNFLVAKFVVKYLIKIKTP